MAGESIHRVTDLVRTRKVSWGDAVKNVVLTAAKSLRDLRVGEVARLDVTIGKWQSDLVSRLGERVLQVREVGPARRDAPLPCRRQCTVTGVAATMNFPGIM